MNTPHNVAIRRAEAADGEKLNRLAGLDSKHLPEGSFLIAEVDGREWAAVELESGEVFADPFQPTANVASLLRMRAARIRELDGPELVRKAGTTRIAAAAARLLTESPPAGTRRISPLSRPVA